MGSFVDTRNFSLKKNSFLLAEDYLIMCSISIKQQGQETDNRDR